MIHCHLRGVECPCAATECRAAPSKPVAPLIRFTARDQFVVVALFGVVVSIALFAAMSRADHVFHQQFLAEQENVRHG